MTIVVDTTVVIACVLNEPHRAALVATTAGHDLVAPESLHWEIGNSLSAMFKRRRITLAEATGAIDLYEAMPLQFRRVDLKSSVELSHRLNIYAYDAFMIQCAVECASPLLTLDSGLITAAQAVGIGIQKVQP
jgi:predicted nucleic acid-binding protein